MNDTGTPPDLRGLRVLVVDDNALNLLITRKLLTRWNATVETADDGLDAVAKTRAGHEQAQPFGLVLMDIQMPNLDGFGASRAIRRFDETVPIVAMSADALTDDELTSNRMNGFVLKPFEPTQLLARLQTLLHPG